MKIKLGFTKEQMVKLGKVSTYIAVSAVISFLISKMTDDPNLFGQLTPLVNLLLVGIKQFVVAPEK